MHMSDALITPVVAGIMYACSATVAAHSVKKLNKENDHKKISIMGVMGAFVFATQMINFSIPGTGSSGHLICAILLASLLGPYAAFLTMIGVLLIQSLLFADGGLLALGCNVWNMAFYGCFMGYYLIWRPIMKNGASRKKIIIACVLGSVIALQLGAFTVILDTLASGVTDLPFKAFVSTMQPIHLAIGLIEGVITSAILIFIYNVRPEMLHGIGIKEKQSRYSLKKTLVVLCAVAILIGGGLSLLASSNPDGLEWSIGKITGSTDLKQSENQISDIASQVQDKTAVIPNYDLKKVDSDYETSLVGILGTVTVLVVCAGACYLFTYKKKKKK